jgi:hypothetical protein
MHSLAVRAPRRFIITFHLPLSTEVASFGCPSFPDLGGGIRVRHP